VCERIEAWRPAPPFDVVITRAFSDLAAFIAAAGRLIARGGRLAAMKGVYPHEEIAQLPLGWRLQHVVALAIPGLRAHRHLVLLEQA
jgi:16S rRNA (guanine527-N7)-methyltransferase